MRPDLFFKENPFVRLLGFFIVGVSLVRYYELYRRNLFLLIILAAATCVLWLLLQGRNVRPKNLRGLLIFVLMASCGGIQYQLHTVHRDLPGEMQLYTGSICGRPILKGNYYQGDCLLIGRMQGDSLQRLREEVRLYLEHDSLIPPPRHGDVISFRARMQPISNRGNPGEFDYAGYMADEGILCSAFLRKEDYTVQGCDGNRSLIRLAADLQEKLIAKFAAAGIQDEELGVISALIAGDRQYLDPEIKSAYIRAGAMHVLAVSGLHVGILYLFLGLLFGSRINLLWYRMIRLVIILFVLWSYAFMTGLSTSVLRAAIMFSFFLLGRSFNRSASSYNLLAASAVLILLLDPYELFKVGFQYSFLAVLGILYFQPRIERLVSFRYALPDRIWQLTAVSLAAQLTTFPLALYYFHQFPSYFLLSNLLIIPLIWLIMVATLLFFAAPSLAGLQELAAGLLKLLVHANNEVVRFISGLPGSSLRPIRFEVYHLVITILFLLLLIYLLQRNKKQWILLLSTSYAILLLILGMSSFPKANEKPTLLIYSLRGQHLISLFRGPSHLLITKSNQPENLQQSISYQEPYWVSRQLHQKMQQIHINDHWQELIRAEELQLRIDSPAYSLSTGNTRLRYPAGKPQEDSLSYAREIWLIDRECGYPKKSSGTPNMIVLTVDLYERQREAWIGYAGENDVEVWNMEVSGAYFLEL